MKGERLFEVLGNLKDEIILEADESALDLIKSKALKRKKQWRVLTVAATAACLLVVAGVAAVVGVGGGSVLFAPDITGEGGAAPEMRIGGAAAPEESSSTDYPLEPIILDNEGFFGGEMGFEGYMAYDIDELVNSNPWNEAEALKLKTLPVFKNSASDRNYFDRQKAEERLLEIATQLSINENGTEIEIKDNYPNEEEIKRVTKKYNSVGEKVPEEFFTVSEVFTETENIKIMVDGKLTAKIEFKQPVTLPDDYDFTHSASYEKVTKSGKYLQAKYSNLLNMENPTANVYGGGYSYPESFAESSENSSESREKCYPDDSVSQSYDLSFFDSAEALEERIVNYNFNYVAFYCDDDGKLFLSRTFSPDLSQKLGDYPIISPEQAKKLLTSGNYITSVPEEFPGEKYIKKTELVYRDGREKIYLPYYRIYVELPDMKGRYGLNHYGAYYVPAIEGKYIKNMPLWDGNFN